MSRIQLKDFMDINMLSDPAFSPDGKHAALLVHKAVESGYHSDLHIYDVAEDRIHRLTWAGDVKSFVWESGNSILFSAVRSEKDREMASLGDPFTSFYRICLQGGEAQLAFSVPQNAKAVGRLSGDVIVLQARVNLRKEERLAGKSGEARRMELEAIKDEDSRFDIYDEYPFWFNGAGVVNKTRSALFLYAVSSGELTRITGRLMDVQGVSVSGEAQRIVWHGCEYDKIQDYRTGVYMYDAAAEQSSCFVEQGVYRVRQVAAYRDGVLMAGSDMQEYNYSQTPVVYFVASPGKTPEPLHTAPLSIGNPVGCDMRYGGGCCFKVQNGKLYLISGLDDLSRMICIDGDGSLTELARYDGSVDSFDAFGENILYIGMRGMSLQEMFRIDEKGNRKISGFNAGFVSQKEIIHPKRLFFTNSDGVEIHGFVLCPPGYRPGDGKNYPAVLNIHGGPRLSYGEVYFHEMQCQAHKGYFVFFCNPRGSDGRGDEFANIRGRYGTIDYRDIMEFTDRVLEVYPEIDAKRLGVSGGSYGGFMINWIIGNTNRFAAAVSQRGISNFVSMEGTSDCGRAFTQGHIGSLAADNAEQVWDQSPLKHADNVTTPTLFIHSNEDYRCWKIEAFQMFNALRQNGVETRMCLFMGENHELSRSGKPKNRLKRLHEIMRFLDRHLFPEYPEENGESVGNG